jgi:transposase
MDMGSDRLLVADLVKVVEDFTSKPERDEYGLEWKSFFRHLRPLHFLENDKVIELTPSLQGVVIEQPVKLCTSPEYRWHFTIAVEGKPVTYTLSARRSKMIEQGALRLIPEV